MEKAFVQCFFVRVCVFVILQSNLVSPHISRRDVGAGAPDATMCPPLNIEALDITCLLDGRIVECTSPDDKIVAGTVAHFSCQPGFKFQYDPDYLSVECWLGAWDNNVEDISCVPANRDEDSLNTDLCGQSALSPDFNVRIKNGAEVAEMFQMPWMALLVYTTRNNQKKYYCSGTIISERFVVTSARCVKHLKSTDQLIAVRVGELDYATDVDCATVGGERICAPPAIDVPIGDIIAHAGFNRTTLENNIALLRLEFPLDFSLDSIKPICLPMDQAERNRVFMEGKVSVAGWGLANKGMKNTILYQKDMPATSNELCSLKHPPKSGRHLTITPKHMCFGGDTSLDSCHGDNGGPIVHNGLGDLARRAVVYGIRSHGPACNSTAVPSVATRVGPYINWIIDMIKVKSGQNEAPIIDARIRQD